MQNEINELETRFLVRHSHPAEIPFFGLRLLAASGIYHPWPTSSTAFLATHLPSIKNAAVLDVGCGTGAIGLMLADRELQNEVTLADVDPVCVAAAECNAMYNRRFVRVVRSDLFSAFSPERRWDAVIFNAPLLCDVPETNDTVIMSEDPGARIAERFLNQLPERLNPGGVCYFLWARPVGPNVEDLCERNGLSARSLARDTRESGIVVHLMEIRVK